METYEKTRQELLALKRLAEAAMHFIAAGLIENGGIGVPTQHGDLSDSLNGLEDCINEMKQSIDKLQQEEQS